MLQKWLNSSFIPKLLTFSDQEEIQHFLQHFDDFFMLCEGMPGSAEGILSACPPSKDKAKDKICLGIFDSKSLIGLIDIILHYPFDKTLTLGYLLVHPFYRSTGVGSHIVQAFSQWGHQQGFSKIRLGVQAQNTPALKFWQKNKFEIIKTIEEQLGNKVNHTHVFEISL